MSVIPKPATETAPKVPAVVRTVRLLDLLASARTPSSLADLARSLNLPKSSVHGLLTTLSAHQVVKRGPDHTYQIGPGVLPWANAYGLEPDLVAAFHELAAEYGQLAGAAVMLARLDGAEVEYLACQPGKSPLAVNFRVGGRFPATCTSSGKAILSTLADEEVRAHTKAFGLPRMTRHSVTSFAALQRQLVKARAAGYALDDEEIVEGMMCFGAPIQSSGQTHAIAAVAVSLIKASVTSRRRQETIKAITTLAHHMTKRLEQSDLNHPRFDKSPVQG